MYHCTIGMIHQLLSPVNAYHTIFTIAIIFYKTKETTEHFLKFFYRLGFVFAIVGIAIGDAQEGALFVFRHVFTP